MEYSQSVIQQSIPHHMDRDTLVNTYSVRKKHPFCLGMTPNQSSYHIHMKIHVYSTLANLVAEKEVKGNPDPIYMYCTQTIQIGHLVASLENWGSGLS